MPVPYNAGRLRRRWLRQTWIQFIPEGAMACLARRGELGLLHPHYTTRMNAQQAQECDYNGMGHGQKNGEGVAAALPRKERRTLWKAALSTSSTTQPVHATGSRRLRYSHATMIVKRFHVGHEEWSQENVGNDDGAREGRPPLPTPARRGGHCVVAKCKLRAPLPHRSYFGTYRQKLGMSNRSGATLGRPHL